MLLRVVGERSVGNPEGTGSKRSMGSAGPRRLPTNESVIEWPCSRRDRHTAPSAASEEGQARNDSGEQLVAGHGAEVGRTKGVGAVSVQVELEVLRE